MKYTLISNEDEINQAKATLSRIVSEARRSRSMRSLVGLDQYTVDVLEQFNDSLSKAKPEGKTTKTTKAKASKK